MTIRMLKEIIADLPDDARIYLDDGKGGTYENNSEIVDTLYCEYFPKKLILQTRDDFEYWNEIEATLDYYREEGYDELDAFLELGERGYTLEDFRETDRYEWAKEFTKTHAWEGEQL